MKRFYTLAAVAETEGGFSVTLDGRPIRTPVGKPLLVPHLSLAEAIAGEWLAQEDDILPHSMPLTQLASTAIDKLDGNRQTVVEHLLRYCETDLLCYRAELPRDLALRQELVWQPIVDWTSVVLGAEMLLTTGLLPITQPEHSVAKLREKIEAYDDLRLTALQSAVAALGSLLLGLALIEGRLTAGEAYAASELDATYQIEFWGDDPESTRRREALRKDIAAAGLFLELCLPRDPPMRS